MDACRKVGTLCGHPRHAKFPPTSRAIRSTISIDTLRRDGPPDDRFPACAREGTAHSTIATPQHPPQKRRAQSRATRAALAQALAVDAQAPASRARRYPHDAMGSGVPVPCCVCGGVVRGVVFVSANGGDAHLGCASAQLRSIARTQSEAAHRRRLKSEAREIHAQGWASRCASVNSNGLPERWVLHTLETGGIPRVRTQY